MRVYGEACVFGGIYITAPSRAKGRPQVIYGDIEEWRRLPRMPWKKSTREIPNGTYRRKGRKWRDLETAQLELLLIQPDAASTETYSRRRDPEVLATPSQWIASRPLKSGRLNIRRAKGLNGGLIPSIGTGPIDYNGPQPDVLYQGCRAIRRCICRSELRSPARHPANFQ